MLSTPRAFLLAVLCITGSSTHAAECSVVRKNTFLQRELSLDSTNSNCVVLELSEKLDSIAVTMLSNKAAPYSIRVFHASVGSLDPVSTHNANPQGMLAAHLFPNGRTFALAPTLNTSGEQRKVVHVLYTVKERVGFVVVRIDEP